MRTVTHDRTTRVSVVDSSVRGGPLLWTKLLNNIPNFIIPFSKKRRVHQSFSTQIQAWWERNNRKVKEDQMTNQVSNCKLKKQKT